jgi:hypothetical protein
MPGLGVRPPALRRIFINYMAPDERTIIPSLEHEESEPVRVADGSEHQVITAQSKLLHLGPMTV